MTEDEPNIVYQNHEGQFFIGPLTLAQYQAILESLNLALYWNDRNTREVAWAFLQLLGSNIPERDLAVPDLPSPENVPVENGEDEDST